MNFLIESTDIANVGRACFICNCYKDSCYHNIFYPTCPTNSPCMNHCWGQVCNPRQDPIKIY
ncbi:TPA: hypothetical protein ACOTG0_002518 [Clostridium perfringens]